MLAKIIKWEDFHGNPREETFYFNLSKAEMIEWELSLDGGLAKYIEKIIAEQSGPELITLFQDIIGKTFGEKTPDGKRFVKNAQALQEFKETEAYSILFTELAYNAEQAAIFVNGVLPQNMDT